MQAIQTPDPTRIVRPMRRFILLFAGIGFALGSFVLAPLFIRFATDVAYKNSWWVYALYALTDGGLLDLTIMAVCYPAVLYAIWRVGFRKASSVPLTYALLTLAKYLANFLFPALTYEGALPDIESFLSFDLPVMLGNFGLEMAEFALVLLFAVLIRRSFVRKAWFAQAEVSDEGEDFTVTDPDTSPLFDFQGLIRFKNPVQLSALLQAVVVTVMRIAMHQIYQYTLYLNGGTEGIGVMVLDLLADLFIGVLVYFAALLLMGRFHRKELAEPAS